MQDSEPPRYRVSLFIFPVGFLLLCLGARALSQPLYRIFVGEDGPVEFATALTYLCAGVLAFGISARLRQIRRWFYALLYGLLAMGFLFIAGEEISWGQRLLGVTSPEFFMQHNIQGETNLHNLVHGRHIHRLYVLVAGYAALAGLLAPRALARRIGLDLELLTASPRLMAFFLPAVFYYLIPIDFVLKSKVISWREQEPIELLLAMGFALFVLERFRGLRTAKA